MPSSDLTDDKDRGAQLLRSRAHALAKRADLDDLSPSMRILEFTIDDETYAFTTELIEEVFLIRDLAPIPGTPAFVLGITNVRGQILSVVDLAVFLGLSAKPRSGTYPIVILRSVAMEFAIATDSVSDVREIPEHSVQRSLTAAGTQRDEYLLGTTSEGIVVLDAARMLADPRLTAAHSTPNAGKSERHAL